MLLLRCTPEFPTRLSSAVVVRAASASPAGEEKLRLHVVASAQGAARATLQEPEARSDLGPTARLGPRLGGASVTTGLGGASVRGSTEPRWRFGEIKNGWIWCNLAHIWWIHEACGGGCGRGRWDPPDQREIRRDPAVFKQIQQFCVLNGLI